MACVSLLDRTLDLVANRPRRFTYRLLAIELNETGHACDHFTEAWLKWFATGKIANPDVRRVQVIYEFLSGTKLFND